MKASSFSDCEYAVYLRDVFAVLEPVSENPKRQSLGFRHGLVTRDSVAENTWELCDFADPPAVLFALDFDVELAHSEIVTRSRPWLTGDPPMLRGAPLEHEQIRRNQSLERLRRPAKAKLHHLHDHDLRERAEKKHDHDKASADEVKVAAGACQQR